ncbi:MAG: 1-acyl-sn-glycerol-3-phosphate acyltransferase [Streptosporangiaceae bacterium]
MHGSLLCPAASRHAGPGDSFLLVHQLLSIYQRRPRVVMKATLQLDPNVDIVGNRLPNVFIKHRPAGERIHTEQIGRLARGLDQNSALVIFPEGGNWPPDDGAAGYCGWSTWDIRIWPNGPGKCPTCSRRAPVARLPPSRPARR